MRLMQFEKDYDLVVRCHASGLGILTNDLVYQGELGTCITTIIEQYFFWMHDQRRDVFSISPRVPS